ncbi:leucine--tRNA ligase [bacterium (Candidatus Howlettbacteria) CG_4_10_14_0_8_um_filter_40_9]|nr:MAG: leucine--tRNA ligase [bacterium (Candidatus Howlettbacteria) CG_4_10_14_0_8_um_filter_40_9]
MSERYNQKTIEDKWRSVWEKTSIYNTDLSSDKPKLYNLMMFPYPSASYLHIGHVYSYTGGDVYARFKNLNGFNVFEPIGYDAFGLPAENFAFKNNVHPNKSTKENIEHSEKQLKSFGCMFDWEKTMNTSDPSYYKWTQWLFLKLYEQGLAYQKEAPVNWCPGCKTVLANEQVVNGECERCDSIVEQKYMKQWFFKTTDYADRLIADLDKVDWPKSSVVKQRNWIGKSEGTLVKFQISNSKSQIRSQEKNNKTESLKFMPHLVPLVLSGEKYITYRLESKEIEEGDVIVLINKETLKKFALAKIKKIEKKKIGDLNGNEPGHEKFNSREELYKQYEKYYNRKVNYDTDLWIYEFELQKFPKFDTDHIEVFTTRVDTIFGCTYLVVAPEHPIVDLITTAEQRKEVEKYKLETQKKSELERQEDKEKTGVFTGAYVINPANGEDVPVWIADFVIGSYGGGAVFADAHDERDFEFAKKYKISLKTTISPSNKKEDLEVRNLKKCFTGDGILYDSGEFNGLNSGEARKKITNWLEEKGLGSKKINYRLRDWSFSRQRYWGAPIPIVYCDKCGAIPVPEKDLPVLLPELDIKEVRPSGTGKGPLANVSEFVNTKCPKCGGNAERETDTMDTFVDSSFYFLRYPSVGDDTQMMDAEITKKWLPVDMYTGGAEHVTMHLLYARFITKALHDAKLIDFDEPFLKLRHQGMILGPDGKKMSKSKGNVVIPDETIREHGADVFRTYLLFMGPFEDGGPWNPEGMKGIKRFLDKVWSLSQEIIENTKAENPEDDLNSEETIEETALARTIHKTIKKVTEDINDFKFNTAISAMMECVNELIKVKEKLPVGSSSFVWRSAIENLTVLLSPFAPHMAEEIWEGLGFKESIIKASWPSYDKDLIIEDTVMIAVQVNGKVRDQILIAADAKEEDVKKQAYESEKVQKYIDGKEIMKTVFVPGKLISIVVKG